jgi:excisionase family DNA binding protein
MGNYEGKLGEWLKYVQQQVDAVSKGDEVPEGEAPRPEAGLQEREDQSDRITMRDRLGRVMPENTLGIDSASVIADPSLLNQQPEVRDRGAGLFEDSDIPNVEDFLPFLKEPDTKLTDRPRIPEAARKIEPEVAPNETLSPSSKAPFADGTGDPRPVVRMPQMPKQPEPEKPVVAASAPVAVPEPAETDAPRANEPRRMVKLPSAPTGAEAQELWGKLPRHIQLLVGQSNKEVAQHSYKQFKETRDDLVARLLDPTLSLEETARVLNVCPTTVRRYTNRGSLRHLRTAGNQRRFRLSDVLGFLESQTAGCE